MRQLKPIFPYRVVYVIKLELLSIHLSNILSISHVFQGECERLYSAKEDIPNCLRSSGRTARRRRRGGICGSWSLPQDENGLTYLRIIRSIHTFHSSRALSQDARQKRRWNRTLSPSTPLVLLPRIPVRCVSLALSPLRYDFRCRVVRCDSQ